MGDLNIIGHLQRAWCNWQISTLTFKHYQGVKRLIQGYHVAVTKIMIDLCMLLRRMAFFAPGQLSLEGLVPRY